MIISITEETQTCAGAEGGIFAAEKSDESLANIGLQVELKSVAPNWTYIAIVFSLVLVFVYGGIGLFIYTYN